MIHKRNEAMKHLRYILILIGLLFTRTAFAQPGAPFIQQDEPAALVAAYYDAITLKDYARAYSYWEQAPRNQTEAQFAAGFADTASASAIIRLPIFQDAGAGNIYAEMPTLVTAVRNNNTTVYFAGCFTAHKTNVPVGNATEPDPNWYLRTGTLRQASTPNLTALDTVCQQTETLVDPINSGGSQLDPVQLIQSYFVQVANGITGDSYWPNGDAFAAQYGQNITPATGISVYVNPKIVQEGAAGSIFASIPALTILTNGNTTTYVVGCYTARRVNVPVGNATEPDPNWHFENATLSTIADGPAAVAWLNQGCAPA
jgi:hypothetical protein